MGQRPRLPISKLIDKQLAVALAISAEVIAELHKMRELRNRCAHGEAPSISRDDASDFAYRAWAMAWNFAECSRSQPQSARSSVI